MDFQVNEQTYFLGFGENDRQWKVFLADDKGPRQIPVYVDAPELPALIVLEEDEHRILN